jgi:hypothetical protein
MSQELPPDQSTESPASSPGSWRRPVAYLLLLAGVLATFFNADIGRVLGTPNLIIQIAALGLLLAGAALFYSVRERVDRVTSYRQAFTRLDVPDEPQAEDNSPANPPKDKE